MQILSKSYMKILFIGLSVSSLCAKMTVKDLDGKWCSALNSTEILGAHDSLPNPTMNQQECLELKVVRGSDEGGIGRYILTKSTRKGSEYPIARHPLERFDEGKQLYQVESPGLFAFYTTRDGQIILNDQSLSRALVTANGMIDTDGKMKYLLSYKPKPNQIDYASVAFLMMEKESQRSDHDFDQRWQSLRKKLDKVQTKRRK